MTTGTYIGPIAHLKNQRAMLRKPPEQGFILAQFNNATLRRDTAERLNLYAVKRDDLIPADALGYGWHAFKAADFRIDPDQPFRRQFG